MRTHPLNVSYLVVGLIFVGLAGSWALRQSGVIDFGEVRWMIPATLVLAGAIGLVASAAKGAAKRRRTKEVDDYDPYYYDTSYNDSEGEAR